MKRILVVLIVALAACGAGNGDTGPDTPMAPVQVGGLVTSDEVVVVGFVVWDAERARFCSELMESFPAQCGGDSVDIANPGDLDVTLDEASGVQWSASPVELTVSFDGTAITVLP